MSIPVVAAIMFRGDRILICQRRADDTLGLKWEFPGGKVHPGESLQEALLRELREELGVTAQIGPLLHQTTFTYGESARTVDLCFFRASIAEAVEVRNLAFETIVWELPGALSRYDFLPADRELVRLIVAGRIS